MNTKTAESDATKYPAGAPARGRWTIDTWLAAIVASWLVACFLLLSYRLRYATPLLTDDLIYHLAIPAHWLRHGWNAPFTAWFHEAAPGYSPMLVERLALLLMLPAHNEVWARWVQLPFQFGIAVLTYRLLRSLQVRREPAILTSAATLVIKPFFGESISCHNDLAMTFFFLLAMWGGAALWQAQFRRGWTRFVVGVFKIMATKYVGLVYAAALTVLAVALVVRSRHRMRSPLSIQPSRAILAIRVPIAGIAIAIGVHTYVVNGFRTGNPVFPAEVSLGSWVIFPGLYSSSDVRDYSLSLTFVYNLLLDPSEPYTLSLVSGSLAVCASVACALLWIARRRRDEGLFLTGVLPWLLLAVYYPIIPFREPRLAFPIYSLCWCAPAVLLSRWNSISRTGRIGECVALATLGITACVEFNRPVHWLTGFTLGTAVIGPSVAWAVSRLSIDRRRRLAVYSSLFTVTVLGLGFYVFGEAYSIAYDKHRNFEHGYGDLGRAWAWVNEHTKDSPAVIAYSGTSMHYPLYGDRCKNDVRYIHIHPDNFDMFHEYINAGFRPVNQGTAIERCNSLFRSRHDVDYWLEQIRANRVQFLVLARETGTGQFPIEAQWAMEHSSIFENVFDSPSAMIFKVDGGPVSQ